MSDIECAWLGAFLEADGSAMVKQNRRTSKNTFWILELSIGQSINNPEPISAALRTTQAGVVTILNRQSRQITMTAPLLYWRVCRRNDVLAIATQIKSYSEKVQIMLSKWEAINV